MVAGQAPPEPRPQLHVRDFYGPQVGPPPGRAGAVARGVQPGVLGITRDTPATVETKWNRKIQPSGETIAR